MNKMKKLNVKMCFSALSFSVVFFALSTFSNSLSAQNLSELDPVLIETFTNIINEELVRLKMITENSSETSNEEALMNYYSSVRDIFLFNSIDIYDAFVLNLHVIGREGTSDELYKAIISTERNTENTGELHVYAATGHYQPTADFQALLTDIDIKDNFRGLQEVFQFIQAVK